MKSPRCLHCFLGLVLVAVPAFAADLNVTGNITATGTIDTDANSTSFGAKSTGSPTLPGVIFTYTDNSVPAGAVDSFQFLINRNPASWLWLHNTPTTGTYNAMRLDNAHQLILFRADGTTAGMTFTPQTGVIKFGTNANGTLTGNDSTGLITAGGGLTVSGSLTASNGIANTTGAFTSQTALSLTAGGTNQNITLTPSGSGNTILNGNVGIGTPSPGTKLDVSGGLIRSNGGIESYSTAASALFLGYGSGLDGSSLQLFALYADTANGLYFDAPKDALGNKLDIQFNWRGGGIPGMFIKGNTANVGIGTTSPTGKLDIVGSSATNAYTAPADQADLRILSSNNRSYDGGILEIGGSWGATGYIKTAALSGNAGAMVFGTRRNSSDATMQPSMTLDNIGNVGIGTISPGARLQVGGSTTSVAQIGTYVYDSVNSGLTFTDPAGLSITKATLVVGNNWNSANGNVLNVYSNGHDASLLVNAAGNVGVGTINPETKLSLRGENLEISLGRGLSDLSGYNRFGFNTAYQGYWSQNATWNGAQWNHVVGSGYNGAAVKLQQYYGNFQIDTADAGVTSDPIAWNTRFYVANNGNIGIGTATPSHKLAVKGTIRANEVIVDTGWADYVFDANYRLAPLSEVEQQIKAEKHLPGIPSAQEIAEHGVSMGDMQSKLLSKVEELTLHLIRMEKENAQLRQRVQTLEQSR